MWSQRLAGPGAAESFEEFFQIDNPGRDRQAANQLEPAIAAFEAAGGRIPIDPEADPRLVRVRWMLEELRVGLFAQELRTAETVSPQRIAKALAESG